MQTKLCTNAMKLNYLMNFTTSFKIMAKSIMEKPIRSPEYPPISATMLASRKYA